jgi:hypothetical protein
MLGKLIPREGRFFDLFDRGADLIIEGALEFRKMISDLSGAEKYSDTIKDIEHKADNITHQTVEMLHKTFITPIDRDDIHQLITRMDDILDLIEAAAQRIVLYGITKLPAEAFELADVCVKSAEYVKKTDGGLHDLKHPEILIQGCVEINRLENEADQILRKAMAKLFKLEPDTRQVIKLKDIYELLETATDRCEDVANIVEGIVLEYA